MAKYTISGPGVVTVDMLDAFRSDATKRQLEAMGRVEQKMKHKEMVRLAMLDTFRCHDRTLRELSKV